MTSVAMYHPNSGEPLYFASALDAARAEGFAAGMGRAAEICRDRMHSELISAGVTAIHGCAEAIRAEITKGAE